MTQNKILFSGILDVKQSLCERLDTSIKTPLPELISIAYRRWGEGFTEQISGDFKIAIWDTQHRQLLLVNAALSPTNLFYWHKGDALFFSSSSAQLRSLVPEPLVLNPAKIVDLLALSHSSTTEEFYQNLYRIPNAHMMIWKGSQPKLKRYWSALDFKKQGNYYPNQQEGIAEFQHRFKLAVASRIEGHQSVASHLSGGLDSSSVSVIAANQLKAQQQCLHAIGVVPQTGFKFPQKPNWNLDDREKMQAVARFNGNIDLKLLNPSEFGLSLPGLAKLCVEQTCGPCRNPLNTLWIYGSLRYAHSISASVLLTGQMGNASVSWTGLGISKLRFLASQIKARLKYWAHPHWWKTFSLVRPEALKRYQIAPPSFVYSGRHQHHQMADILANGISDAGNFYSLVSQLFGVAIHDPTAAQSVFEHCLQLPDHYFIGQQEKRLLIRNSMKGLLPESTRLDNSRGEQHADWFIALKNQIEHYKMLLPEFRQHGLIPELIDIDQMGKLLKSLEQVDIFHTNAKDLLMQYRLKLARSLHVAEWIYYET